MFGTRLKVKNFKIFLEDSFAYSVRLPADSFLRMQRSRNNSKKIDLKFQYDFEITESSFEAVEFLWTPKRVAQLLPDHQIFKLKTLQVRPSNLEFNFIGSKFELRKGINRNEVSRQKPTLIRS